MAVTTVAHPSAIDSLPEVGFLRLSQVLSVFPVSKSTWWSGVRSGRYPKQVRLSQRCTAWRAEDIRSLIAAIGADK